MSLLNNFNKDIIIQYENEVFLYIQKYIQEKYPNQSFLFVLESWNRNKEGIAIVKDKESINLGCYESWISIYPMYHHCYVSIEDNTQILSACIKILDTCIDNAKDVLKVNDHYIHQLSLQLEEIISDMNNEKIDLINHYSNDEYCRDAKLIFHL